MIKGRLKISFQTTFDQRDHKSLTAQTVAIHFRISQKPESQSVIPFHKKFSPLNPH